MLIACALYFAEHNTADSLVVADVTMANNQHTAKSAQGDYHNIALYKTLGEALGLTGLAYLVLTKPQRPHSKVTSIVYILLHAEARLPSAMKTPPSPTNTPCMISRMPHHLVAEHVSHCSQTALLLLVCSNHRARTSQAARQLPDGA